MRWPSPPERLPDGRSSVRYSSPTSARKFSRSRISFKMSFAISASCELSFGAAKNASACLIDIAVTSEIDLPLKRTYRLSFLSRAPLQVGHGRMFMYASRNSRAFGLCFLVAPIQPLQHALERFRVLGAMMPALVRELDLLGPRAVHDRLAHLGRNFLPRLIEAELVVPGERVEHRLQ